VLPLKQVKPFPIWFHFCGLRLNLKLFKISFSFYSTYKQYKLFWYFLPFFKILKTQYWDFHSAEYFFAFSHSFKYQKFFAAKTLTQMSHLFCSRIGSYRLLLQMDYLTRCLPWLLLGLDLMLLFFWLTEFFSFLDRISHYLMTEAFLLSSLPQYHWLLFHHIAEEIQISSFLKWHHIRLWRSCCCSSSSCLVSHVFYFFFFFFISLVYYLKYPAVTLFILLHCSSR